MNSTLRSLWAELELASISDVVVSVAEVFSVDAMEEEEAVKIDVEVEVVKVSK